ncbi:MAG TPA: DNA-directed RNA polymerase subunit beta' [Planctomycetota bacterium]|nr:DNA-directed RNA polymerase subunit beta' [Planctomycetota bacterium]
MATPFYETVNEVQSVSISLASPDEIRSWSYGEVKKPETINYRTYRAEKDGLFCERIFGPERDWECFCGKYKGMKHKGIICDRCGVKVTHSRERRKRMGHINLAAPVGHIWFFKSMPSRMGNLLAMKVSSLEKVIYFQEYVVVEAGGAVAEGIQEKQLLGEDEFQRLKAKYEDFDADMGAEAVRKLLQKLDLDVLSKELRAELMETSSQQRRKDIVKRLKVVEAIRDSKNRAEWMILDVVPVIPPDLRPLVLLESGNFATSDLNDLYRRVINRNNRLKKLLDLHAPEVIIRNEKRMLQQSVDALFDNERCKHAVLGSSNRPLKSLTDMIKGKPGRFRENLLGKRVDYSGRSVIVVGPELKLHQCGLPKKIALELFQPFIIRRLKEAGLVDTIKSAKRMLERKDEEVWDILDEVIREHPVLLNRAPTLHRMGIQAFEPVLIEGNAIQIHPLVCEAFNADFDGDQMAVHLPLSIEAQTEATILMMSTNSIFSPADGRPIITPSLDIVLGCYYLTCMRADGTRDEQLRRFASPDDVLVSLGYDALHYHSRVYVRLPGCETLVDQHGQSTPYPGGFVLTTAGRVYFNTMLPTGLPFYNTTLNKSRLNDIIADCHHILGRGATLELLDTIKELGFRHATLAGLSISTRDLRMPPKKADIIAKTEKEVEQIDRRYRSGVITDGERYNLVIERWTHAKDRVTEELMAELRNDTLEGHAYLNPIWAMFESGARGNAVQITQLAGMRGLMAKPSGKIIETPIKSNFREGLPVLEYFSSTHGGRKGLADTALKTAESGYLTRKLADVAQNAVVTMLDCGTVAGVTKSVVYKGDKVDIPIGELLYGRVSLDTIVDRRANEPVVREGEVITDAAAQRIEELGLTSLRVRSPMMCEASHGVCAKCYGMDLSTGELAEDGLAVGIIAAQSIGEPGTQLTMRTFHYGGTAATGFAAPEIRAESKGRIRYYNLKTVETRSGELLAMNPNGALVLEDDSGNELRRYEVKLGASVRIKDGLQVTPRTVLATWEPHFTPVLSEIGGFIRYEDIVEDETVREEVDQHGSRRRIVIEHKGDLHPQIAVVDQEGRALGLYSIPEKAHIMVEEGKEVHPGDILARTPREIQRVQDITGGLPRVTELFEARKPKDPAIISEISGRVTLGERKRGKRIINVTNEDTGDTVAHLVPHGKHLTVHDGDYVKAGDRLVDGPLVPQDILRIKGIEALQEYLLREIQGVYRSQNEIIDDKHIAIIICQMLRKVKVGDDVGDTSLLPGSIVDKVRFRHENERVIARGGKASSAQPLLLGITKAALQSESFISAASFQETTKVLTEAALAGRTDYLRGLKENVILGHLIPAGTGFPRHYMSSMEKKQIAPPPPVPPGAPGEGDAPNAPAPGGSESPAETSA